MSTPAPANAPRYTITTGTDTPRASWMVPVVSTTDPEDPWSGYHEVNANAVTGLVEHGEDTYTPAEARAVADAWRRAADHAEEFGSRAAAIIDEVATGGHLSAVIGHLPDAEQAVVRTTLREIATRYRTSYPASAAPAPAGDR